MVRIKINIIILGLKINKIKKRVKERIKREIKNKNKKGGEKY